MHLGSGLNEASNAIMVATQSLDRANVFSMCFIEDFINYDMHMDPREGTDGVTPYDAYIDEMDMIGVSRILDIAPHMPHSAFDLFEVSIFETDGATPHDAYVDEMDMIGIGRILDIAPHIPYSAFDMFRVFMLEMDDDDFVTDVSHDDISIEGASNSMNLPLFFDTMFGFVTRYDGMSTEYHNDISIFEYSTMSLHFPTIASPTPTTQVHDMEDVESPDDPLRGQSSYDFDLEEKKVKLVSCSIKSVDFETLDQPRELKIGTSISPDERNRLIDLLRSYLDVFAWSSEDMLGLDPSIV